MAKSAHTLSVMDTIKSSWSSVSGSKAIICAAAALILVLVFCVGFISGFVNNYSEFLARLIAFVGQIALVLLEFGVLYIGIMRAKNSPIFFKQVFRAFEWPLILKVIGVVFLVFFSLSLVILVYAGIASIIIHAKDSSLSDIFTSGINLANIFLISWTLICIFAYLYVAIRLLFSIGFVIDQSLNPWQAYKSSVMMTRGNELNIFLLVLLQFVIFVVAALPLNTAYNFTLSSMYIYLGYIIYLGIIIWALPFCSIVYGTMYKNLQATTPRGQR